MLPPEALEGAFGEGASMLQILLLLWLIVEDIDLGKEERTMEGGEIGWRVEVAHSSCRIAWPTDNLFPPQSGPCMKFTCCTLCLAALEVRRRRVVQIKRRQWARHHNCLNQSLQFQASFSPHVIDSEHTQHYRIHVGECGGLAHKHPLCPCPLAWPWSVLDKFTILFFLKSQSMGCRYAGLAGRQGLEGESMRGW